MSCDLGLQDLQQSFSCSQCHCQSTSQAGLGLLQVVLPQPESKQCRLVRSCVCAHTLHTHTHNMHTHAHAPGAAMHTIPTTTSVFAAELQQGCHLLGKGRFLASSASEPFSRHLTPLQPLPEPTSELSPRANLTAAKRCMSHSFTSQGTVVSQETIISYSLSLSDYNYTYLGCN